MKQRGCFDLDKKRADIRNVEKEVQDPKLWDNRERAQLLTQNLASLKEDVGIWEDLELDASSTLDLAQELAKEKDRELESEVEKKLQELKAQFQKLELSVFLNGKFDNKGAIISISAGAGGTDAQDWAEMLERMLLRYAEQKGFSTRSVDRQQGQEAGIKSSMFEVKGKNAYGWLKSESGVHRLVRISPFDAEAMRHTSFALVDIIPDLGDVDDVEIREEDLRVDVFRASGHGGQSVNTTDSAVRIVHNPTNITVSVQNERSQQQNKQTAMKILKSRIAQKQEQERDDEERRIRGDVKSAEWGSQIRSYVLHPYKLVKDHRTNMEKQDVDSVLRGELDKFSESYVRWLVANKR
ncbi:MAG: peptide chain release factor 2 [Patescibacteria group bacterium]|nr:peptide chain release factor 2 [Patescibacteria group bacterium]MDP6756260.1 peptide chain release factor 2 [Patescibacteria group bacterium]